MLAVAYTFFLANFTFGLLVGARIIPSMRFRRLHHALYFGVMVSLAGTIITEEFLDGHLAVLPAIVFCLLLAMPLFRGGSRLHAAYAVLCLVIYTAVVML
jgi:hypothetical protein